MGNLLSLWYLKSPAWAYGFYLHTLAELEVAIAVQDMLRNLRRPLFQDYTLQGRLIGLAIRLARISFGVILYAFIAIAYAALYIAWLAFPFVCLISIAGAFFGAGEPS